MYFKTCRSKYNSRSDLSHQIEIPQSKIKTKSLFAFLLRFHNNNNNKIFHCFHLDYISRNVYIEYKDFIVQQRTRFSSPTQITCTMFIKLQKNVVKGLNMERNTYNMIDSGKYAQMI